MVLLPVEQNGYVFEDDDILSSGQHPQLRVVFGASHLDAVFQGRLWREARQNGLVLWIREGGPVLLKDFHCPHRFNLHGDLQRSG